MKCQNVSECVLFLILKGGILHLWLLLSQSFSQQGACSQQLQGLSSSNVAPSGTASQSSTLVLGDAYRAIDGNRNSAFYDGSCSHTLAGTSNWWSLQLPAVHRITHISVTNRNVGAFRIDNTQILIGNSPENNGNNNPRCAVIKSIPAGGTSTFYCEGMVGRWVNLYLSGTNPQGVLTACEVEVYGEVAAPSPSFSAVVMGRNVAVVQKKLCWSDAVFYCRDFYWDLLSIRSEEEQKAVEEVLPTVSFSLSSRLWLGLRRHLMGSTWFWMSGDQWNYTGWARRPVGHPRSPCGGISTGAPFHWWNLPCEESAHFICLKDYDNSSERVWYSSSIRPQVVRLP
ncbi:uncharacterized protein V6R79_004981 [Siganus canaliculatus]